jgi:hypothetical protein
MLVPIKVVCVAAIFFVFSIFALMLNLSVYHFYGNNYFPPGTFNVFISLLLIFSGTYLTFGKENKCTKIALEFVLFFILMSILALATNAIQFTPFLPIDDKILQIESGLHLNLIKLMQWTHDQPQFKSLLTIIYDSLPYQMCYLPIFVILMKKFTAVREYYLLMLISALLGFSFYYFCPTTAPASIIKSQLFSKAQCATGLKFFQIHHGLTPSTLDGGMIALPSFHAIWAWFCLYLVRGLPIVFALLLPVNFLLVASCVLLGWHYIMDILGALIIVLITHYLCSLKIMRTGVPT